MKMFRDVGTKDHEVIENSSMMRDTNDDARCLPSVREAATHAYTVTRVCSASCTCQGLSDTRLSDESV